MTDTQEHERLRAEIAAELAGPAWFEVVTADDVTDEVFDLAESVTDGWYSDGPIDWEDVWDRMEGSPMDDGRPLSMGSELDTPAMRKIQRHIRELRRAG